MFRYIYALLVSFLLCGVGAFAYGQDAQVQGQVSDPSGAAIPKAVVRVVDERTGTERKAETNDSGQYMVPGLTPGSYMVYAQAPGFGAAVSNQITLSAGQSSVLDFTLKVGAASTDVVVTAEKRNESLYNVPVPVAVIEPDNLVENNQTLLRDYFSSVPSLDLAPDIFGSQVMDIRGITTGGPSNPTVGVLVDDVPFGATAGHAGGSYVPDFDPGDLDRIEVLRGPQGTLYGADSLGGLIKYVTKDPSTDRFTARLEGGTDGISNGTQPGYSFRASANIPLSSTLAVRVNGFARQEPGYINNIFTGQNGVNKTDAYGGRVTALWKPSDSLSLKLTGLYQYTKLDGINESNETSNLGQLQQNYIAGLPHKHSPQAYSVTLKYRFKGINLTSLTGFNTNNLSGFFDYTPYDAQRTEKYFGVSGTPLLFNAHYKKATEELRLTSSTGKIDWLAGFFYTIESNHSNEALLASVPTTGQIVGSQWLFLYPDSFDEYAGFFDVTYHFSERLDVQIGGRESFLKVRNDNQLVTGPLTPEDFGFPSGTVTPGVQYTGNSFTYLATPQYHFSSSSMLYARFASGYRPGGPNDNVPGVPAGTKPDTTQNYDVGYKGTFLKDLLSVDLSLYYVNWQNIQLSLLTPPPADAGYNANGSGAKSEGAELSLDARPFPGLKITPWIAYDNAVLTQPFPANSTTFGEPGDRLPNSPVVSANVTAEQYFSLSRNLTGYAGLSFGYVGDRKGVFVADSPLRQDLPAYTKTDLNAGINYHTWKLNFFATNVGDVRGLLNGGIGYIEPNGYVYITPRKVGFNLVKTF